MPKVMREATIILSPDELSKALGIPFETITGIEWDYAPDRQAPKGLKLRVALYEEIEIGPAKLTAGKKKS